MKTNIIDRPRKEGEKDLLGTDKYMEALNRFILSAHMPTTIAIQGEWGSGKTSMMNQIRHSLCESEANLEPPFHGVWINTWHYSLMKSPEESLVSIIEGLSRNVLEIIERKHKSKSEQAAKKISGALKTLSKTASKAAIKKTTGLDGNEILNDFFGDGSSTETVLDLRNALNDAINQCLELDRAAGNNNIGFINAV